MIGRRATRYEGETRRYGRREDIRGSERDILRGKQGLSVRLRGIQPVIQDGRDEKDGNQVWNQGSGCMEWNLAARTYGRKCGLLSLPHVRWRHGIVHVVPSMLLQHFRIHAVVIHFNCDSHDLGFN